MGLSVLVLCNPLKSLFIGQNGEGGADVQFDMGKGDITFSALGQDFQIRNFSGTAMHGKTELLRGPVGSRAQRIQKAFVFVPQTPMVLAQMAAGRGKFKDVQREVGHGIKHFIAAHERRSAAAL